MKGNYYGRYQRLKREEYTKTFRIHSKNGTAIWKELKKKIDYQFDDLKSNCRDKIENLQKVRSKIKKELNKIEESIEKTFDSIKKDLEKLWENSQKSLKSLKHELEID